MIKRSNFAGLEYGNIQVIERAEHREGRNAKWNCRCACGKNFLRSTTDIKVGLRRWEHQERSVRPACGPCQLATRASQEKLKKRPELILPPPSDIVTLVPTISEHPKIWIALAVEQKRYPVGYVTDDYSKWHLVRSDPEFVKLITWDPLWIPLPQSWDCVLKQVWQVTELKEIFLK